MKLLASNHDHCLRWAAPRRAADAGLAIMTGEGMISDDWLKNIAVIHPEPFFSEKVTTSVHLCADSARLLKVHEISMMSSLHLSMVPSAIHHTFSLDWKISSDK